MSLGLHADSPALVEKIIRSGRTIACVSNRRHGRDRQAAFRQRAVRQSARSVSGVSQHRPPVIPDIRAHPRCGARKKCLHPPNSPPISSLTQTPPWRLVGAFRLSIEGTFDALRRPLPRPTLPPPAEIFFPPRVTNRVTHINHLGLDLRPAPGTEH